MNKQEFSILLQDLIEEAERQAMAYTDGVVIADEWNCVEAQAFEEVGIVGVTVKLADGSKFNLTIQEAN
jgi:hypothetical protein